MLRVGSRWDTPTIQQGLVNGDPDMDAIFRLSRKPESTILNVTFDPLAPPVILPEGVFSPFNSQNTLFHHAAFWALFIPTTTTFRVCDIWRGYWAQRLMWEVGGRLAFFPANAFQERNSHSYLEDAGQEKDMYFHTEELLLFLRNWSCEESFSFFQCVLKLTSDMSERNFWKHDDVKMVKLWLQDLQSIGYPEPTRVQFSLTLSNDDRGSPYKTEERSFFTQHAGENESALNNVLYSPLEQPAPTFNLDSTNKNRFILKVDKILSMCEDLKNISLNKAFLGETKNASFFSDILLIIVFNFPHYSNVKHLDAIHSLLFPYIVYCGDNQTKFQQESGDLGRTLTFIEVAVNSGYDGYMCAVKAMEMGYKVKGYLIAGDDVLFKPWSLLELNKSHAGVTFNQVGLLNISEPQSSWYWWNMTTGRDSYLKSIEDLKQSNVPSNVKSFVEFQRTTLTHTKSSAFAAWGMSDFYYIPTALRSSAVWYFSKLYQHHLFLEMAVPFVMCGLESKDKMFELAGLSVWGEERNKIDSFYQKIKLYMHPAKLSQTNIVSVYCKDYFPEFFQKMFSSK
ncbi:uncharacterized protein LOC131956380 [Physella acuta]|uniref:uncharacterized protein LOC131956380 n=1 Tax=Physella acuta TaxID=109671 RepID=UPI0027DC09B1|nr:uncharacterized protein LOC131956380 [Physella acuta]